MNKRIELNKTLLIVNEMLKLKDRNSVEWCVQEALETLIDNFNCDEGELRYVIDECLNNLQSRLEFDK